MDSGTDQTQYDKVFKLLEPQSGSTDAAFRQCRLKLLKFFSWRGCDDAASLADETIVRLLTNVDQGGLVLSGKPYSYVYGIAMNIFYEYKRNRENGGGGKRSARGGRRVVLGSLSCIIECV